MVLTWLITQSFSQMTLWKGMFSIFTDIIYAILWIFHINFLNYLIALGKPIRLFS